MWDIKRQTQFTGIRHYKINIRSKEIDVNVSEMQNPIDFCGRFQPWDENIQRLFVTLWRYVMKETTECQKHSMNICIKKQRQSNHVDNRVSKGMVRVGTMQYRSTLLSNKGATL